MSDVQETVVNFQSELWWNIGGHQGGTPEPSGARLHNLVPRDSETVWRSTHPTKHWLGSGSDNS